MTASYKFLSALSIIVLLSGCANVSNPNEVAKDTKITFDPYTQSVKVTGDRVDSMPGSLDSLSYFLRGSLSKDAAEQNLQLYVRYWGQSGWYFFSSAHDITGKNLPVVQIDRNVETGANIEEVFAINLTYDYLVAMKNVGLNIKISGSRGSLVLVVPPAYVTGFLKKFDEALILLKTGEVPESSEDAVKGRHTLGIRGAPVDEKMANALHLSDSKGFMVVTITSNSPASSAGLKPGDIIQKINGQTVTSQGQTQQLLSSGGASASVEYIRGGKTQVAKVEFK